VVAGGRGEKEQDAVKKSTWPGSVTLNDGTRRGDAPPAFPDSTVVRAFLGEHRAVVVEALRGDEVAAQAVLAALDAAARGWKS
jgi:hypothetical protein